VLPTLADNSVDAIVTDPPYELGFMGKSWDSSGIAYSVELWAECLRVLKPGGHLLAFSGSRTYHRMTVAIEDSGFEIRDMISWISNKTFPKSMDVSKAIDKAAGIVRERVSTNEGIASGAGNYGGGSSTQLRNGTKQINEAATDKAKTWAGWGTALKPTVEPIVMARKPVHGTIANNVLTWGVGGLNIDQSRITTDDRFGGGAKGASGFAANYDGEGWTAGSELGRWPANIILDESGASLLDQQQQEASRFFYVAKASKHDRNEGLDELPDSVKVNWNGSDGHRGIGDYYPDGRPRNILPQKNSHPTVKPTALMEYLIKLITPAGGLVLDPFAGSGSTGKAALLNGYQFIGCEMTAEYLPIIEGRLIHAAKQYALKATEKETKERETLF
jgi:site-specific DNA-methyltransferase (adenine-specific)